MTQDALLLLVVAKSLDNHLVGGKVNKIVFTAPDEIVFSIYGNTQYQLLINLNPQSCRIHLTTQDINPISSTGSFYSLLKKFVVGSKLVSITQTPFERAIVLKFLYKDALGYTEEVSLAIELTGKTANMALLSSSNIIKDVLKRYPLDLNSSTRQLAGGIAYQPLISSDKFLPTDTQKINENINDLSQLMQSVCGIGAQTAKYIDTLEGGYGDKVAKYLEIISSPTPVVLHKNNLPSQILPSKLQCEENADIKEFADINQAYDYFFSFKKNPFDETKAQLQKTVTALTAKLEKKVALQLSELDCAKVSETNRIYGELLLANLHQLKNASEKVEVLNYYDNTNIEIPLEKTLTISQNAQRYFKKYAKQKSAVENLGIQLDIAKTKLEYLYSISNNINLAKTQQDLVELEEEIQGLQSKQAKPKKQQAKKVNAPTQYQINGYKIFLGRNNLQNEEVTFAIAEGNDIWMHTKNMPSAHLIIVTQKTQIDDDTLVKCAEIVASSSKTTQETKIEVDYTLKKHVKKPSGSPLGFVRYTNQKSLLVSPNKHEQFILKK